MPGIATLEFNLMQRELTVGHTLADTAPVLAALGQIGMAAVPVEAAAAGAEPAAQPPAAQRKWWLMGLAGASAVAAEAVAWGAGEESAPVVIALALLAIATGGLETYRKGWIALRNFNLNINALMSIAVTGAMLIGQWPEAAMVMFLFALAELIEQRSLDRARNAIRGLLDMAPETATVRHADGSWATRDAKSVAVGALARVAPGERVPLDGRVIAGQSSVNQAPITGESIPVDKGPGDPVFAGTINESGSFEFEVTAPAADTTLARIIHAVEQAQGSRAPTQRFIDRFARVYTPAVFAVALLAATVPPLLFDGLWVEWSYRALVLLVIACPCALVISTPVSIVSGLAAAARHGILVKGGAYLEESRSLAWLALDKTGTITHGRPAQTDFEPVNGADAGVARRLAASLAARSDHPVSKAVAEAARRDGVALAEVEDFAALPGRGVKGTMAGREYHFGNHRLVEELGLCSPALEARLAALEEQGKTTVLLVGDSRVEALFGVADTIRNSSRQAIAELHGLGVRTVMLSGDNEHTVRAIARQVGIDEVRANVLPVEKQEVVEKLLGSAGKVGMVGDGINDAPALARADIGIAMGAAGTDTAIETADVALMDDDLRKVPALVRLSRATAAVLKQNIALALGIKAVFLVLALAGEATMWMAVFADVGASLIVVANGLRLLRR